MSALTGKIESGWQMIDKNINTRNLENIFDSLSKEFVNEEEQTGAVVMGAFSEDSGIGFNAAHGDLSSIVALISAIIEHSAEKAGMSAFKLMIVILKMLSEHSKEDEWAS